MSYNPKNANGQATSANSSPVVIASDQSAVPVSGTVTVQQATAANLKVDLSGTAANATALKVDGSAATQPVSGTVTANAGTGTFAVNMSQLNGSAVPTGNGTAAGSQRVSLASDSTGQVALAAGSTVGLSAGASTIGNVGLNAGSNLIGSVAVQDANGNGFFTSTADPGGGARGLIVRPAASTLTIGSVNVTPSATGGWNVSSQTNLTTTATVSAATGKFGGYMFINTNTSVAYIQVFDTTGAVTLGTTAPTFVVPIPAGAGANIEFTNGIAIASGIKVAATTTATGATTVSTGLTGFVLYK